MAGETNVLWPYRRSSALVAIPLIWIGFLVVFLVTRHYFGWPDPTSSKIIIPVTMVIGFVPLLLVLVEYVAGSRAVLDIKGIKIDFSQTAIRRTSIELPDNIGRPEPVVSDSSPMQIVDTLESATANQIVRLDIRAGNAWWVTRLFALSVGAVRAGSPKVFVFVGVKENVDGTFLGWAAPSDLLRAMLGDNEGRGPHNVTYDFVFRKASWITKQLTTLVNPAGPRPPVVGADPQNLPPLPSEVQRYLYQPTPTSAPYAQLGEAALEQVLMDQLAAYHLEDAPDRLTLGRLEELFAHFLYRDMVDLQSPKEQQIAAFLDSNAPYVAVVRKGKYEGLVERAEVERIVIREMFARAQREKM